jgi:hypothetical protein
VSGVLATLLGIPAGMGLVALCGLEFTNILGILPFLIIGVLLFSSHLSDYPWAGFLFIIF